MKLSEILMGSDARMKAVMRDVNAIYLENRWEFETTTVCSVDGVVKYVRGEAPKPPEREDGEEIAPGVIWRKEGALGLRPNLPEWKIRNNKAKAAANERSMMRSFPVQESDKRKPIKPIR